MVVIHYLFEPFLWKINGWLDLYASFEGVLRFILLFGSIRLWLTVNNIQKFNLGFMLIMYFLVTLVFAYGTTNYGTSIRHNLVSYWIIGILGSPFLFSLLKSFFKPHRIKREVYN